MRFFLPGEPPTASHHHKRIVKMGARTTLADRPELVATKRTLDALLTDHKPAEPLTGPLSLTVGFVFPYTSAVPKKARGTLIVKAVRPDLSNLIKTLEDRLVKGGFLVDDGQVAYLVVSKHMGPVPGIHVKITPLDGASGEDVFDSQKELAL